jgi:DNA-binding XRE family transcriptional regulator
MTFGEKLRQLREAAGITQEGLAASSGVNLWTLRGYEQGRREPNWKGAIVLARALGVSCEAFADCEDVTGGDADDREPKPGKARKDGPPKAPASKKPSGRGKGKER